MIHPPEVEHSDAKGLGALAKRLAGQELRCEPALAKDAHRLEHLEAGQPEAQRFDVSVLRSALGLEKPARR